MTGHSWFGIGGFLLLVGIVLSFAFGAWTPIFIVVALVALVALPTLFAGKRAVQGGPEESRDLDAVSQPDAPPDASPRAPHGYTPSV
jgi:hypothetical protein